MIGKLLYVLMWPFLWVYIPLTRRVRVAVIYDGQVLLAQNWIGTGKWDLPGGGIKFGESAEGAAIREVREELGLHIENVRSLHGGTIALKRGGLLQRLHFLQAAISSSEEVAINWEIAKTQWIPISELGSYSHILPASLQITPAGTELEQSDTL